MTNKNWYQAVGRHSCALGTPTSLSVWLLDKGIVDISSLRACGESLRFLCIRYNRESRDEYKLRRLEIICPYS
jgi:hypothetical protein